MFQGGDEHPAQADRGQEIDLERFPPVLIGQLVEGGQLADGPDVVDQHVQPAQLVQHAVVKILQLFGEDDVHRLKEMALTVHFLLQRLQAGFGAGATSHLRSRFAKRQRQRAADTLGGASDEDFAVFQIYIHVRILLSI